MGKKKNVKKPKKNYILLWCQILKDVLVVVSYHLHGGRILFLSYHTKHYTVI